MVMRIESGRPVAHVAAEMGISRPTAYKWWRRWQHDGVAGLVDRSSRPRSCPHQTPSRSRRQIAELRMNSSSDRCASPLGWGCRPRRCIGCWCRLGLNRLAWMDRPTGRVIRRIHTDRPGELVHVDIKKLGRIPDGGGWKVRGRGYTGDFSRARRVGYGYVHSAVDAHTRLAYSEVLSNEQGATAAEFWQCRRTLLC